MFIFFSFFLSFSLNFLDTYDCDPNPCLNEGKCSDGINDFACTCKQGYEGKICEDITGKVFD